MGKVQKLVDPRKIEAVIQKRIHGRIELRHKQIAGEPQEGRCFGRGHFRDQPRQIGSRRIAPETG